MCAPPSSSGNTYIYLTLSFSFLINSFTHHHHVFHYPSSDRQVDQHEYRGPSQTSHQCRYFSRYRSHFNRPSPFQIIQTQEIPRPRRNHEQLVHDRPTRSSYCSITLSVPLFSRNRFHPPHVGGKDFERSSTCCWSSIVAIGTTSYRSAFYAADDECWYRRQSEPSHV